MIAEAGEIHIFFLYFNIFFFTARSFFFLLLLTFEMSKAVKIMVRVPDLYL